MTDAPLSKYTEVSANLQRTFDLLATGQRPRKVAHQLAAETGLSRRTCNNYVARALGVLMKDHDEEPIESKRARIVAALAENAQKALQHNRTYVNKDGEERSYAEPDYRASTQALVELAKIEGIGK